MVKILRVYVCPDCGFIRPVARRKEVRCYKCDSLMTGLQLTYVEYAEWTEDEREAFVAGWMEKNRIKQEQKAAEEMSKIQESHTSADEDEN